MITTGDFTASKVPKRFTVQSVINGQLINFLISFPVKSHGTTYDALTLLQGLDRRAGNAVPDSLEFDAEHATEMQTHFRTQVPDAKSTH